MKLRDLVVLGTLTLLVPQAAMSQATQLRPAASALFRPIGPSAAADTLNLPKTYWKEGAVVAGAVTGVLGYSLAHYMCGDTDSGGDGHNCGLKALGGFAFGFLLGAIPGALIGGQIERSP